MARSRKKDGEALTGRKTFYDNHLFSEEPPTALRANLGITARLLGTCCLGGAAATTKSPIGVKPNVAGNWEDCPAFDLDPLASRPASISLSVTGQGQGRKVSDEHRNYQQQVPLGEHEQAQPVAPSASPARGAGPGPGPAQPPAAAVANGDSNGAGNTPTHDSATEMYSDNDSLPAADSPLPHRDRQSMQHRVALRLLERRGVFSEGAGARSGSSSSGGLSPAASGGLSSMVPDATSPTLPNGSGLVLVSPNSVANSSDYQSAVGSLTAADGGLESPMELDECGMHPDDEGMPGGFRQSAPGMPGVSVYGSRHAWGWGDSERAGSEGPGGTTADSLRMRGSDYGGIVGSAVSESVYARGRSPCSAVLVPQAEDEPRLSPHDWSAAGGRQELSQEEKEWLFGQQGGIGGLAPVMALGEGGEGLVDLVRMDLPSRTLHLARKATRTCLPAYALTGGNNGVAAAAVLSLGVRSQNVSYRFPFEFFDREVRAMKAVKDSGFVIRFQAAAYDHEAGQGFILMEAAPYGTLEDLHAALCRSQLRPAQRQRPALLNRAFAKLNFSNAKSSAPPFLAPVTTPTSAGQRHPLSLHNPPGPDRPSVPRGGAGIGSCGGAALEMAESEGAGVASTGAVSCCASSAVVPSPATTDGRLTPTSPAGGPPGVGALGSSLMTTRALKYYGACMLQALVALHEANYVYRDLKLSNVLVCDAGRVRLTDFGAAATCLPDQPGLFSGAAGTRAYLAPEVLPWLETGKGGATKGGSSGPEPYTVTVDSWTWGLVMVELATGWSLKELTLRIIRRVCHPKSSEAPDLPPDCGLPPALRQLLLDHVLVRDPRQRWSATRIRNHRFFDGVDWEGLAEAEGPHAHLFTRGHLLSTTAVDASPGAVAAAMMAGELGGRNGSGSRKSGNNGVFAEQQAAISPAFARTSPNDSNAVLAFGPRGMCVGASRPSYTGPGPGSVPASPLSPAAVLVSPAGSTATAGVPSGAHRLNSSGFSSPGAGGRMSSPGGGLVIGPVVTAQGSAGGGVGGGSALVGPGVLAGSGGGSGFGSRRHTTQGSTGTSRLSAGVFGS